MRKALVIISAPLVALVLVGAIGARVEGATDETLRDLKVFGESLYLVNEYYVEDVPFDRLERGAFQGLAESLDPWSSYWDPARMRRLIARDETGGVGLLLVKTPQQYVRVAGVVPDGPADEAEVRQGQYLETIDDMATKDLTLLEAQHMLRGPVGSTVELGYFRTSDDEEGETVTLTRAALEPLRVVVERPSADVALVRVTDLRPGAAGLVGEELRRLADEDVDELVLDLRANLGGTAEEAAALADLFLDARPVFQRRDRRGTKVFATESEPAWKGDLVVLVGTGTIGEAELVAEALREAGKVLIGEKTFGKRSQQELVRLRDGSGIFMSVGEYRRADGEALSETGVEPNEVVAPRGGEEDDAEAEGSDEGSDGSVGPGDVEEMPPSAEDDLAPEPEVDRQLERALEILAGAPVEKAA